MIPFRRCTDAQVSREEMQTVYEAIRTPNKLGAVVKWEDDYTDSPTVFRFGGTFYMYFIAISKDCRVSGYETHLAKSDDLFHWEYVGPVFRRNDLDHWDSRQVAGYAAFSDIRFGGTNEPEQVNGSYYITYLAGNSDGYEPDPLLMGMAKTSDPTAADSFVRFERPILTPDDEDSRPFETKTLYKSCVFRDPAQMTGYPYVNCYNAKGNDGRERIFLAVSEDGERWERYGEHAILDLASDGPCDHISGDPQIIKIGDIYVMVFFRFGKGRGAYDSFACSKNLADWTVWDGDALIEPEFDWENVHAHKPWILRHDGRVFHFYCAVNDKNERYIALAVSDEIRMSAESCRS